MNFRLEGGCQVPIAGYAEIEQGVLLMRGLVGSADGSRIIRAEIAGKPENADELGTVLAEDLLSQGAKEILSELYKD
jgi:hydroxymethylbilane synthase